MSATPAQTPAPRVREQAREVAVLMSFSLVVSLALTAGFLLLAALGR
ncbi:hypothetical protein [Nocardioides sp. GXZ039]